jgi:hypothetical protein
VGRNTLQLESNHVQTAGYQDVEAVGLRKSGFRERLRFLLNAMRQQSSVDDLLDDCRQVDSEHGVRGMACRMPRCRFSDGYSGAEVWLGAQRDTSFLIRLCRSVSCAKRDVQISLSTYPSWQKSLLLSLVSLVLNR